MVEIKTKYKNKEVETNNLLFDLIDKNKIEKLIDILCNIPKLFDAIY